MPSDKYKKLEDWPSKNGFYAHPTVSAKSSKAIPQINPSVLSGLEFVFLLAVILTVSVAISFLFTSALLMIMYGLMQVMPAIWALLLTGLVLAGSIFAIHKYQDPLAKRLAVWGLAFRQRLLAIRHYLQHTPWQQKLNDLARACASFLLVLAVLMGSFVAVACCAITEFYLLSSVLTLLFNPLVAGTIACVLTVVSLLALAYYIGTHFDSFNAKLYAFGLAVLAVLTSFGNTISAAAIFVVHSIKGLFVDSSIGYDIEMQPLQDDDLQARVMLSGDHVFDGVDARLALKDIDFVPVLHQPTMQPSWDPRFAVGATLPPTVAHITDSSRYGFWQQQQIHHLGDTPTGAPTAVATDDDRGLDQATFAPTAQFSS